MQQNTTVYDPLYLPSIDVLVSINHYPRSSSDAGFSVNHHPRSSSDPGKRTQVADTMGTQPVHNAIFISTDAQPGPQVRQLRAARCRKRRFRGQTPAPVGHACRLPGRPSIIFCGMLGLLRSRAHLRRRLIIVRTICRNREQRRCTNLTSAYNYAHQKIRNLTTCAWPKVACCTQFIHQSVRS